MFCLSSVPMSYRWSHSEAQIIVFEFVNKTQRHSCWINPKVDWFKLHISASIFSSFFQSMPKKQNCDRIFLAESTLGVVDTFSEIFISTASYLPRVI